MCAEVPTSKENPPVADGQRYTQGGSATPTSPDLRGHDPNWLLMVEAWLNALGVKTIDQWDVLAFLHRHGTVLLGVEHIARLMRHDTGTIVTALDSLSS